MSKFSLFCQATRWKLFNRSRGWEFVPTGFLSPFCSMLSATKLGFRSYVETGYYCSICSKFALGTFRLVLLSFWALASRQADGAIEYAVINDFYLVRRSWSLYYMFVRWTAPIFNIGVGTRQALLIVTEKLISTRPPYTPTIHLPHLNCSASRISWSFSDSLRKHCFRNASRQKKKNFLFLWVTRPPFQSP